MAKLQGGTRIYGNATIDTTLYTGNVSASNNISVGDTLSATNIMLNGDPLVNGSVNNLIATFQSVTVIASNGPGGGGGARGTINVTNLVPITTAGIVITAGSTTKHYVEGTPTSGSQNVDFFTDFQGESFTVYGFVTTPIGTVFSSSSTSTSTICLVKGTMILMADGKSKPIEDITYQDRIIVWNFDEAKFDESSPLWIKKSETTDSYNLLTFSDGHVLRTINQHRIFNKQRGGFTYPMSDDTPIGTITFNQHGKEVTLVEKQVILAPTEYYNVITEHHLNLFANTILTSCRLNNLYPIQDMKFVKDNREWRSREEFNIISDRFYHGLRLTEQTLPLSDIELYVERLIVNEIK